VALRSRHIVVLLVVASAALAAGASVRPALAVEPVHSPPSCGPLACYYPSFLKEAYDFPTGKDAPTGAGVRTAVTARFPVRPSPCAHPFRADAGDRCVACRWTDGAAFECR